MAGQTAFSFETAETAVHFRARVRVTLGKGKGYPSQGKGYPRLPGVESLSTPGSSLSKHVILATHSQDALLMLPSKRPQHPHMPASQDGCRRMS
jgi:hypothetical protein